MKQTDASYVQQYPITEELKKECLSYINQYLFFDDLLDGLGRIVSFLRMIDERVKGVNVLLCDFFLRQKLLELLL